MKWEEDSKERPAISTKDLGLTPLRKPSWNYSIS